MNQAVMLDPALGRLIVGCFVLLYVSATSQKLRDLKQFAEVCAGYRIAPAINRWRLPWLVAALIDNGGVLWARGLVNSREHLESPFEAQRLGVASLPEYFSTRA